MIEIDTGNGNVTPEIVCFYPKNYDSLDRNSVSKSGRFDHVELDKSVSNNCDNERMSDTRKWNYS